MPLVLYNTLSNQEEAFVPLEPGKVTMYTCGPTVYGRPHIGNYSSFLMADLLRRWLEVSDYEVTHCKNITDVGHLVADADAGEDKVEKQALEEKTDPLAIAKKYTDQYLEDEKALNFIEPEHRPNATETIPEMIAMVKTLMEKGHAYETDDGVYFSVQSFPEYGKLSGNTVDNLNAGARVEVKEEKKHPADFALWKKCVGENADHILRWDSPWGEGFPGWHLECSCMGEKFLGKTMDIHTGGEDLIFPHHECEIAQSEGAGDGTPHVRYWIHKRFIDLGDTKMSKSLGNVLNLSDIVDRGYSPLDLRYYLLSVHYRTNLKFTEKGLSDAHKARRKIVEWMGEVGTVPLEGSVGGKGTVPFEHWAKFEAAMNADLNTPEALAVVFDVMTLSRTEGTQGAYKDFAATVAQTFGCFDPEDTQIPEDVQALLDQRLAARNAKDFTASDQLRDQIRDKGFEVRDEGEEQVVRAL